VIHCRVRAAMFYKITFTVTVTDIAAGKNISVVCAGDIEGEGVWTMSKGGEGVESVFVWSVVTGNILLKIIELLPFGRRFMQFNHRLVMEEGYRSFLRM
jgi:hypothetical protein